MITRQVRLGEVHASVVTEWPPTCLHKLIPRGLQTANKKTLKKDVPNLINIHPTNPIQVSNLHEFLRRLCMFGIFLFLKKLIILYTVTNLTIDPVS